MTVVAVVPFLVALLGALAYLVASKPELKEMGRLAFACGLLVVMLALAGHVVRLGAP